MSGAVRGAGFRKGPRGWAGPVLSALLLASASLWSPRAHAATVELTMWDVPESEPYTAWWRKHVEAFNAAHPDIHVTLEVFETEAYRSKIAAALASGTTPEIFYLPAGPQGFQAYRDKQAVSIKGMLDPTKFTDTSMAACSVDGTLVCMPLYIAPNLMFYNKALFARASVDPGKWADPTQPTWAEFTAACAALKAEGVVPVALGNGDNWPGTMWMWAFQNRFGGIGELDAATKGTGGQTFAGSPGFQKGGEQVRALGASGWLPLGYNGITGAEKYSLFTNGTGAIIFQGPWLLGRIAANAPSDFSFGVFNFPSVPGGAADSQRDVVGGFDALFVSSEGGKKAEAVAAFLNGFSDKDAALSFMNETRNIPVVKAALDVGPSDPALKTIASFAAQAPHITPWWDNALPNGVAEEATRTIQGLFDGSVAPDAYLAGMDKAAGR